VHRALSAVGALSARPPVTVEALIVSYRTRELLHQTIATLLAHAPEPIVADLSVAVFDNASHDGSTDMVAGEFPAVRLVRSERNLGFAAANNALARSSNADYMLLLNSDVIVTEDLVGPLLGALRADPLAVVAGPRLTGADGTPQPSSEHFPTLRFELARALHQTRIGNAARSLFDAAEVIANARQHELLASREPRRTSFLWATCWLIARAETVEHGLFDERYTTYDEDLDFCRRLRGRGRAALFVPSVRLTHLGGSSSTTAAKIAMTRRGRNRYYGDHHGLLSRLLYRFAIGPLVALKRLKRA
jgi:N-acetylglucosaminyl-diphospho-decaprenol L-rhamnosyltransferase